ncbi:alkaline phosphatase family protein [Rhodohalobacter sp. SW132]|uniref:alkaline phosphatase family protein n=1 Tax=Rhodohalobacter sp. SW132 TaxID=2293433 RepID=UPI000E279336|nr:ectonucleotide pyrophosphatase/phosphodiesterase [Rhodohalobacter sp. SW132]REL24788.1 alkaline phosphatase family protein [Rhodohalobacter sp. SW132]
MKKYLPYLIPFSVFLILAFTSCDRQAKPANSDGTQTNKVLLISFDGFMNEYLDRNETPNFDRFISGGVMAEHMIPVFPTKTFPNHYSVATGLYVENHGIISNSFPDDSLGGRFSYGPPEDSPNDERWWGGEPIWTTVELQGKTSATMFWPGSEASIHGIQPTRWKDYDGSVENIARIDTVMTWLDPAGEVNADFATLYFSDVDSRGHSYGPNSPEVDEAVVEADRLLGYLVEKIEEAGLTDHINILITSDHGMAELSDDKIIFLDEMIDMNDIRVIDWTPVAMLQPDDGKKDEIYQTLKENEENYRVYKKEELPREYHFSNHYRIPEIIMIADVSYTITSRSFYENRGIVAGTHGYDHQAPEMATIFYASGPDIKTGETIAPFQSVHLYELMAHLLNMEPAENDGDLEEVIQILDDRF